MSAWLRFQEVTARRTKNLPCPSCGKRVRRAKTHMMTVNPFNRNQDGTERTPSEVNAMVIADAEAWAQVPELCTPCKEAS